MMERLLAKRTTMSAVGKRLDEIIPYLDEDECDSYLKLVKELNTLAKKNKERMENATVTSKKSLEELLEDVDVSSPPRAPRLDVRDNNKGKRRKKREREKEKDEDFEVPMEMEEEDEMVGDPRPI